MRSTISSSLALTLSVLLAVLPVAYSAVDQYETASIGSLYCQEQNGAQSSVGLISGKCGCFVPGSTASNTFIGCGTGASDACLISTATGSRTDTCGTCSDTDICGSQITTDYVFESACTATNDNHFLYIVQVTAADAFCTCSTPDEVANETEFPVTQCTAPDHGSASCESVTVKDAENAVGSAAKCSFSCNAGYQTSTDGKSCVLSPSVVPRAKRAEQERKRRAVEFIF